MTLHPVSSGQTSGDRRDHAKPNVLKPHFSNFFSNPCFFNLPLLPTWLSTHRLGFQLFSCVFVNRNHHCLSFALITLSHSFNLLRHSLNFSTMTNNTAFCTPAPLPVGATSSLAQRSTSPISPTTPIARGAPTRMSHVMQDVPRRAFLKTTLAALAAAALQPSRANAKTTLSGEYKQDAAVVLADMRVACDLARGTPGMADTVTKTRREMNDFVALYRRNLGVAGSTSFNTLYTAINTLSGHYASYGNAYPVPDKRKKRLVQQFTEIDRALNRGR